MAPRTPLSQFFVLGAWLLLSAGAPSAESAQAWRAYLGAFPSNEIPFLKPLGISLASPARMDGFIQVVSRAGLTPQALSAYESAGAQTYLLQASVGRYAEALAAEVPEPDKAAALVAKGPQAINELSRQFEALAAFPGMVPQRSRSVLARAHQTVAVLSAGLQKDSRDAIDRKVKAVAALWSDKREAAVALPAAAKAAPRAVPSSWLLQRNASKDETRLIKDRVDAALARRFEILRKTPGALREGDLLHSTSEKSLAAILKSGAILPSAGEYADYGDGVYVQTLTRADLQKIAEKSHAGLYSLTVHGRADAYFNSTPDGISPPALLKIVGKKAVRGGPNGDFIPGLVPIANVMVFNFKKRAWEPAK